MSTPQDSPARRKQKRRRTIQLAKWRAKQVEAAPVETADLPAKTASK